MDRERRAGFREEIYCGIKDRGVTCREDLRNRGMIIGQEIEERG
jgi:hypothetical protein